jgi:hypothetical protein
MTEVPDLNGKIAICVANGPSLTRSDCEIAEKSGAFILGVNDSYRICSLSALYAADHSWWAEHSAATADLDCLKFKPEPKRTVDSVTGIEGKQGKDLTAKRLNYGGHGGFQALHLALIWGAKKVLLLGYDCKGSKSHRHWFGNHPGKLDKESQYSSWVKTYNSAKKPDTPIINVTRDTAITCFPRMTIEEALCEQDC